MTRLHAKAWIFHRPEGYSTAYIGSSNLTHSAQVSGLEWNVRVSGARNPDVIDKVAAVFESYWHSPDFKRYDDDEFRARTEPGTGAGPTILSALPIYALNRSRSGFSNSSRCLASRGTIGIYLPRRPAPGRP